MFIIRKTMEVIGGCVGEEPFLIVKIIEINVHWIYLITFRKLYINIC